MSQNVINDQSWVDFIKAKLTAAGKVMYSLPGTGLSFHSVIGGKSVALRNTNISVGGIIIDKVNLSDVFNGIQIDVFKVLGSDLIAKLDTSTLVTHALTMVGLTGVSYTDFDFIDNGKVITVTAKEDCVKFTGKFEVLYAN